MISCPRVSVIMPVYNARRYLAKSVESILNQTLRDLEFIVIDDGSTDDSLRILRQFEGQDERVRVISRRNTGYAIALNEAITLARAPLIARMDADDISLPTRLERQLAFMEQHLDCVASGTSYHILDADGHAKSRHIAETNPVRLRECLFAHNGIAILHPSAIIRRDALERVGGYRTNFMPAEDFDLWLRLDEVGTLGNLSEILFEYRTHLNSITYTKRELQLRHAYQALSEAHERRQPKDIPIKHRGDPASFPSPRQIRARALRENWLMACHENNKAAKRKYALQIMLYGPNRFEDWKNLTASICGPKLWQAALAIWHIAQCRQGSLGQFNHDIESRA